MLRGILFWSSIFGVFAFLTKSLLESGINKVVYLHTPGPCKHVSGISNGSEDFALLKSGHVLISNGLSFDDSAAVKPDGGIYLMDLSIQDPMPSATKMTIIPSSSFDKNKFHPCGVAVHEGSNGRTLLYTASLAEEQIDVFEVSIAEKTVKHLEVIRNPLFHAVDDLVMMSPTSFYVTNFHRFKRFLLVEAALNLPLGTVVFYDGKEAKEVLTGLKGPNGIALSPDGKQIYVCMALNSAGEIRIYDIQGDHSLKFRQTIYLNTGVDNINVDDEGTIWVGAHPIVYQLFQYLQRPANNIAPAQVLKIKLGKTDSEEPEISEVYSDSGKMLKAASVANKYKNRLLIGSVIDRLLLCELVCV